jgi:NADH-quinone oxidoreductase subunit M
MENHLLSIVTFLPALGALAIILVPKDKLDIIRWGAVAITGIQLIFAIWIVSVFDFASGEVQFVEHFAWIPAFNIEYILLTALLSFLAVFSSWNIDKAHKGYFALFLLLDTGMMGVFTSLDFFLFYIFWEVMLLPMYFLIGIWGGPQREYAAIKFFLYTLFGSVLLLLGMLALYFLSEPHTFNMLILAEQSSQFSQTLLLGMNAGKVIFILLFIGFAIKVPIFPFHTWLPLAHVEAPTAISVILAGVLSHTGSH